MLIPYITLTRGKVSKRLPIVIGSLCITVLLFVILIILFINYPFNGNVFALLNCPFTTKICDHQGLILRNWLPIWLITLLYILPYSQCWYFLSILKFDIFSRILSGISNWLSLHLTSQLWFLYAFPQLYLCLFKICLYIINNDEMKQRGPGPRDVNSQQIQLKYVGNIIKWFKGRYAGLKYKSSRDLANCPNAINGRI